MSNDVNGRQYRHFNSYCINCGKVRDIPGGIDDLGLFCGDCIAIFNTLSLVRYLDARVDMRVALEEWAQRMVVSA